MRLGTKAASSRQGLLLLATVLLVGVASTPASALPPSTFESADGNLILDPGPVDWINAPNPEAPGIDEVDPDDSYKGGAKHDQACPPAEFGGIPPNKDDLTKLYVASEVIAGDVFMYIAWQRFLSKESSASAHMGIEFNQSSTPCGGSSENVQRTANDILVLYDLEGGGKPTLTLLKWLTPTSSGTCKAAPAPPCWGNELNLSAAGFADGEVNRSAPITDPIPNPDELLAFKHQFGEAAINLTDANAFPLTGCTGFGRAQLGSRSSGNSFVSTQKDYLGPIPVNISVCQPASITALKVDSGANPLPGAVFELFEDTSNVGANAGVLDAGDTEIDECTTASDGKCTFDDVTGSGTRTFIIHEATAPAGYALAPDQTQTVTFSTTRQTFTLTFVDAPLPGTINIHKEDDADTPLPNITFKLYNDATPVGGARGSEDTLTSPLLSCQTNQTGDCTISNVPLGSYWVVEDPTTVPAGYDTAADQAVTIGLGTTTGQTHSLTFVDNRQHKVIVIVCHEGTNTLAASDVTRGAATKTSLATAPAGITQAALCGLGGASFGGISGHPIDDALAVDVGSGGHAP